MYNDTIINLANLHRVQLLEEAELARNVKLALGGTPRRPSLFAHSLSHIGAARRLPASRQPTCVTC